MSSWTEHPIHFIDFEGNLRSGILEYGVVTICGGNILETSTRLCRPRARVLAEETAVHGLTEAVLRDTKPLEEDWGHFSALRKSGPLGAHCAGAENSLLRSVWPYPASSPNFARPGSFSAEWGPWVDTASLAQELLPASGSLKLSELIATLGLQEELDRLSSSFCPPERNHYHAALYDALAGALILLYLATVPETKGYDLPRLLTLSTQNADKRDSLQQGLLF